MDYVIKASYGNDSVALIQWCFENDVQDATILYNDTGWSHRDWGWRVAIMERWAESLGFGTDRTQSIGLEQLVRNKKSWPRQGIQFCTQQLKMEPTENWMNVNDPLKQSVSVLGVRRAESAKRASFPVFHEGLDGRTVWAPMALLSDAQRDDLLSRAGIAPLPHRSDECFPCINSNRDDIRRLSDERIAEIEAIEDSLGFTSKGKPRTMFRPYRYMGATGIRAIVEWAWSRRGQYGKTGDLFDSLDDGNGSPGCEAGQCGI